MQRMTTRVFDAPERQDLDATTELAAWQEPSRLERAMRRRNERQRDRDIAAQRRVKRLATAVA